MTIKTVLRWIPMRLSIGAIIFMIVGGFDGVVISQVISYVTNFNESSTQEQLMTFVVLSIVSYTIVYVSGTISNIMQNKIVNICNRTIKEGYVRKQLFSNNCALDSAEAVATISNDFKLLEQKYFAILFKVVYYFFMGVISIAYLIYLNFYLSLVFIIFAFLPILPPLILGKKLAFKTSIFTASNEKLIYKVKDVFNGMASIKTYNSEKQMFEDTKSNIITSENSLMKLNNMNEFVTLISVLLGWLSYIIPITVSLVFVIKGYVSSGVVIAMFLACDRVVYPFRNISFYLNSIKSTKNIRDEIMAKLQLEKDVEINYNDIAGGNIYFNNVSFAYDDKEILKNSSFIVNDGDKILISGSSGSGKSTLLDLLEGVKKVNNGAIYYNNINIDELTNNNIARIRQNPYIFYDNLEFNLTLGKKVKQERLVEVLTKVGLYEELGNACLETNYGENGEKLSGGQKQRIEIARALLFRKNVLLVDEVTAALDKTRAEEIRTIIWDLPCTVVEIAHHFSKETLVNKGVKHYKLENKKIELVN